MRPGSVDDPICAPYASSIEDSDLKLSYDLYYLRHFSTWLDLVVLFRTIKTVLKAGGDEGKQIRKNYNSITQELISKQVYASETRIQRIISV